MLLFRGSSVKLKYDKYIHDNSLALSLYNKEDGTLNHISKNLPDKELTNKKCIFVDEANINGICEWLITNNIAEPTGKFVSSERNFYPEFELKEVK